MMNRRPIANVIAFSASATASGVAASPSNSSTPWAPLSLSASARSRRAALGDPAVVVAVDQVGGLERRHRRVYGAGCATAGSAHDDVDQLVRHDDHLGDLVAVEVRLHAARLEAELARARRAARPCGALTRSRTLPLTWQTSSNVSAWSMSGSASGHGSSHTRRPVSSS